MNKAKRTDRPARLYRVSLYAVYGPGASFMTCSFLEWAYDAADAMTQASFSAIQDARLDKHTKDKKIEILPISVKPHNCAGCRDCEDVDMPLVVPFATGRRS